MLGFISGLALGGSLMFALNLLGMFYANRVVQKRGFKNHKQFRDSLKDLSVRMKQRTDSR